VLTPPTAVALVALLVLVISAAAVGLWLTFNPQGVSDMPSFWHGTTDVLRTVRMLGSCQ
jgi:hypothetical protein